MSREETYIDNQKRSITKLILRSKPNSTKAFQSKARELPHVRPVRSSVILCQNVRRAQGQFRTGPALNAGVSRASDYTDRDPCDQTDPAAVELDTDGG